MNGEKRILTRSQVLAWRGEQWSYTDKLALNQTLDVLPQDLDRVEYYEEPDGGRVIATVDGLKAFIIRPGFVSWKGGWVNDVDGSLFEKGILVEGTGERWARLSTFMDTERHKRRTERDFGTCPTCRLELLPTGDCGNCD